MANLDEHDRMTLQMIRDRYLATPGASEREARVTFVREIELLDRMLHSYPASREPTPEQRAAATSMVREIFGPKA